MGTDDALYQQYGITPPHDIGALAGLDDLEIASEIEQEIEEIIAEMYSNQNSTLEERKVTNFTGNANLNEISLENTTKVMIYSNQAILPRDNEGSKKRYDYVLAMHDL